MTQTRRGAVLLVVQCVLVLTTAGKYLWERHKLPQVWTRVELFNERELAFLARDPNSRYLQVQLLADACSLPPSNGEPESDIDIASENQGIYKHHQVRKDLVHTIARDGKLTVIVAQGVRTPDKQQIYWDLRTPCTEARLPDALKFYVPSLDAIPTKLQPGQTVWALVSVPAQGAPRPLQLALSDAAGFHPLGR